MANLQFMPGDPRLVDQLVYELKSKGIFDQFRKECIADVDTRPAYQNLRQRVESSVASFLSRQCWKPELNKNQLREKLRKHLLDGNYLEQGVERIVDQVVNPKVASVFIPQVEDVVYSYLGIPRKKAKPETSNGKVDTENLLPTDLEAVSPGSVKSNEDKDMDISDSKDSKMDIDEVKEMKDDSVPFDPIEKEKDQESRLSGISELTIHDDVSVDKNTITIPLPTEEIKLENIPAPENSPPNVKNESIDLKNIDLPKEPNLSTDIPLPDEIIKSESEPYFKSNMLPSEEDDSSSDSSLRRNMSPLTPIRNFNNENSCDAQQAFENVSDTKTEIKEPNTFRFTIESGNNSEDKVEKKDETLTFQYNQANVNTPLFDDSSNSHNLQIDYESDVNSKLNAEKVEPDQNSGDSKKEKKDDRKSSQKSSHRSRDSHRHSSSKDKDRRSDSKHSTSRDSSRHDKKPKDDKTKSHKEKLSDRSEKKESRDTSKHRSSSSHKDSKSSHRDSKSHRSSSSSKHSSKHDDKRSSSHKEKDKNRSLEKSSDKKDKPKESKSSSVRSDKDRKKSKHDEKEKEKKEKKDDDHYSLSGRGNPNRRSTDRDSNDGSSSSKGSHNPAAPKPTEGKKESKGSSKSENTSSSSDSTSPSDKDVVANDKGEEKVSQTKKVVRVDTHLETPISPVPRLPFVPDVTLKKPRFAANLAEAKKMVKMRKFLEEEQKRMNQEAALLLEFQANVRPSMSQVYSNISGPELEFACGPTHTEVFVLDKSDTENNSPPLEIIKTEEHTETQPAVNNEEIKTKVENMDETKDLIVETLLSMHREDKIDMTPEDIETENDNLKDSNIDQPNNTVVEITVKDEAAKHVKSECVNNENIKEFIGDDHDEKNDQTITKHDNDEVPINIFETTLIVETLSEDEIITENVPESKSYDRDSNKNPEENLQYFAEHEKYSAELERDEFSKFLKTFLEKTARNKMYLINCDSYEENLLKEASRNFGTYEIVNYYKNGHLKLSQKPKHIVKNVNVATEITLPTKTESIQAKSPSPSSYKKSQVFSPTKSECSFELSSDYDAKLEEMVNKTSRQEIMEIILGSSIDESPSKMPQIDYCSEESIQHTVSLKRKYSEVENNVNNNRQVLTPNKIRKRSGSDQISSTTEESDEMANNNRVQKSKYLGKAKKIGLPRPKKNNPANSPSSDKSVENYEQNTDSKLGKVKAAPRSKVQRYDTSDLYKPKLHYLSRRNNIS